MILVLKKNPDTKQLDQLEDRMRKMGLDIQYTHGTSTTLMVLVGETSKLDSDMLKSLDVVENAIRVQAPYKLVSRQFHPENSVVDVAGCRFGGEFQLIAGPCSVENKDQICQIASDVKNSGATMLRGGAFKPRTSPYSFQGMRGDGIKLLLEAKKETGLPIITEILDIAHLDLFENVDIIQVGARNMQNFELLRELGKQSKPILLKRGSACTVDDLLMSAEHIMNAGNSNIILCERGIRTFENSTRNTLDLSAIPVLKKKTHLPVIVDPSHGTGNAKLVPPMAMAAVAAGADGLMIEVHNMPQKALSDGPQAMTPAEFDKLVQMIKNILPYAYDYKY